MNKIIIAAQFADNAHREQLRKYTGRPYISHPDRVAARVARLSFADEDMVCAAWLHDTVEDCKITLDEIGSIFGEGVRQYVWELTNPSKGRQEPRWIRKEMDRKHLRVVSKGAKCIKMVDRTDNLLEISAAPMNFKEMYARESILLLNEICDACPELAEELRKVIDELK